MSLGRNIKCFCNSGNKYKHCCGAASEKLARPSAGELESLAVEVDEEGLALGEEPKQRAFMNVLRMTQRLGLNGVILGGSNAPPIIKRIHAANDRMFRVIDKREGGVHLGFFMFRDFFAKLSVPMVFGSPHIDFVKQLDLSDDQKRWMGTDPEAMASFNDQAIDLFDFAYGYMEFGHTQPVPDRARELIYRSHIYLEAAAATATSAYDFRGTLQSALIGAEMALKAALVCHGVSDEELRRKFGHSLSKSAEKVGIAYPDFDSDRVIRAVSGFPDFAQSRYGGPQPNRQETGHILMKSQYIASEVTRLFTDRNLRADGQKDQPRNYPA